MLRRPLVLLPHGIEVDSLGQVGLPVLVAVGKIGVALALVGFFAATFGAACAIRSRRSAA